APGSDGRTVGHVHRERRRDTLSSGHWFEFKLDLVIHMASAAARLRAAAEAKPLRLPINRRVDESHHLVTPDGLSVWYTIQVSPHSRIQEAIFERDGSIEGALPDAVVLASSTDHVAAVMKVAAKHRIPVVPRGAGTGLSGGAVTIRGGIALQVTRMRHILEIDPVAQTALVEPGVVNQELSLVAAQHGLFYAPDPSSQKACTIGGNAAENSGGPHCL